MRATIHLLAHNDSGNDSEQILSGYVNLLRSCKLGSGHWVTGFLPTTKATTNSLYILVAQIEHDACRTGTRFLVGSGAVQENQRIRGKFLVTRL